MTENPSKNPETPKGPETQKPAYPLNFDFTGMNSTQAVDAQRRIFMTGNRLDAWNSHLMLRPDTREVQVSLYIATTWDRFLQCTIFSDQYLPSTVWVDDHGNILKTEPVNGISPKDVSRILLGGRPTKR